MSNAAEIKFSAKSIQSWDESKPALPVVLERWHSLPVGCEVGSGEIVEVDFPVTLIRDVRRFW